MAGQAGSVQRICIDIDNVIADTDRVLREVIREHSAQHADLAYHDIVCFDYWLCRDSAGRRMERQEWPQIHREFTSNHLSGIRPYDGVADHLRRLTARFEIHLATSRLPEGRGQTVTWLERHNIPHHKLHFVEHGQKHLIRPIFAVAVEDDREQAYAFANSGTRALLLAHPWNEVGSYSVLQRISKWEGLVTELLVGFE